MTNSKESLDVPQLKDPDLFEIWINERPRWLQSAACFLIDNKRMPDDSEIEKLAKLCIKEALREEEELIQIVPGTLANTVQNPEIRINKVFEVLGVNAIKNGASLAFGEADIAVVYGANGTGKSSFSRLLKQACGSRAKDDLIGNIFSKESPPASAEIEICVDGKAQSIPWSLTDGAMDNLRNVHIFDTKTAQMYLGKNEATYEPSRMRFISSLITICDDTNKYLKHKKNFLQSKLPVIPAALMSTNPITWLKTLNATTKLGVIEKECQFSVELDHERIQTETALSQKDSVGRIKIIAQDRFALMQVKNSIEELKSAFSDEALEALINAKINARNKRSTANDEAKNVFSNVELEGVGQSTWMALWKHAKQFSELHAYPNLAFPYTGDSSNCVLCQQELSASGKDRLSDFQAYVQGGLEADAKAAENLRDELLKKLPVLPIENAWLVQMNLLKVPEGTAREYLASLTLRSQAIDSSVDIISLPKFEWGSIEEAYKITFNDLAAEEKTLKELQEDGQRQKLEARLKELQAIQWLHLNQAAIQEERLRLVSISEIDSAIKLTSTNNLTKKNNELAQFELDAGYQERFAEELKNLGGTRILVKPESKRHGKGKITFGLTLESDNKSVHAEKILSEGEIRIVTLAAFIADIRGSGQKYPFIFDDPISSLDQDFEENVVTRLVDLSKDRQVIVFTHRLSLLSSVESAAKKLKDMAKEKGLPAPVTVKIETLRKLGNNAGIVAKLSLRDSKPPKAATRIKNEFIPQLKKHFDNGDADLFEREARQVCSEFRILVEKCVESVLLNDVLVRFRRDLQTKGRLSALTKVEQSDCDFIDDLMTRYSVFEHSQSDELPAPSPDLVIIEQDVDALILWIGDFTKR